MSFRKVKKPRPGPLDGGSLTPCDIGQYLDDWHDLPHGTVWADETHQRWRKNFSGRLKVGGSHANAGAKPTAIRMQARGDLREVLFKARDIALGRKSRPADVLKAIDVLHRIGGLQSLALLNADAESATLPPFVVATDVAPELEREVLRLREAVAAQEPDA